MHTKKRLILSPNPAHLQLTIETTLNGCLKILNLSGQEIYTTQINGPTTKIDVSTLPGGIYVLKLVGDKGVQTEKFIKE